MIDAENVSKFIRGEPYDEDLFFETIQEVTTLVISRHFSLYKNLRDEFYSISVVKCFEFLRAPYVIPGPGIINGLYTKARNSIGNWLKSYLRKGGSEKNTLGDWQLFNYGDSISTSHCGVHDFSPELKKISSRFDTFGLKISRESDRFLDHGDMGSCSRYAEIAIKASAYRAVYGREGEN